jgi:hypothetical protein
MGKDKKERRLEISRILFIVIKLGFKIVSRVIEGVDFIHPEGFLVKGVESEGKSD